MAISLIKEFRQKQKISLTPLLKKSIDLLQLSRYELIQKIDHEIEINPFVEKEISEDFDTDENYNDSSFDFNVAAVENLRDTLINQINDLRLDEHDKGIALTIIDCIDESGQLIEDINESNEIGLLSNAAVLVSESFDTLSTINLAGSFSIMLS